MRKVQLRDATLREGLDTPGVSFSADDRLRIAEGLVRAGIREAEVVAPARVLEEAPLARRIAAETGIRTTGLVYAASPRLRHEIDEAHACLDRFDLLMPLSSRREPSDPGAKEAVLLEALELALAGRSETGVGFPHATQAEPDLLGRIARHAVSHGARRVTVYDTNGSADPFAVRSLVESLCVELDVPLFFHAHDDLGLATANSLAAALAGASGVDVTVNGLGDRAGNACLEQVVVALLLRDHDCGVTPEALGPLSRLVEDLSGVAVSKLAPVVGQFVFAHRSPAHLGTPSEFEAFDPELVGGTRMIDEEPPRNGAGP